MNCLYFPNVFFFETGGGLSLIEKNVSFDTELPHAKEVPRELYCWQMQRSMIVVWIGARLFRLRFIDVVLHVATRLLPFRCLHGYM